MKLNIKYYLRFPKSAPVRLRSDLKGMKPEQMEQRPFPVILSDSSPGRALFLLVEIAIHNRLNSSNWKRY